VNTSSNPPSASDHPVIRAALLRDFYDHFETKFAEIWKLIKGGTDKSLVGALSKDDVALRISEIVAPARRRYDAAAFKERQKELITYGVPVPKGDSYFDVVKRGIQAAQIAADNLEIFLSSLTTLDHLHIQQTLDFLNTFRLMSKFPGSEDDFTEFLKSIETTRWNVIMCQAAMKLATGQRIGKRRKGRPATIYTPVAIMVGKLWEELTGRVIVTPKSRKKDKDEVRPGSPQTSTQFVWLTLQMVDPNIKLQQAETAIRNVLPALRLMSETTDPEKKLTIYKSLFSKPRTSQVLENLLQLPED